LGAASQVALLMQVTTDTVFQGQMSTTEREAWVSLISQYEMLNIQYCLERQSCVSALVELTSCSQTMPRLAEENRVLTEELEDMYGRSIAWKDDVLNQEREIQGYVAGVKKIVNDVMQCMDIHEDVQQKSPNADPSTLMHEESAATANATAAMATSTHGNEPMSQYDEDGLAAWYRQDASRRTVPEELRREFADQTRVPEEASLLHPTPLEEGMQGVTSLIVRNISARFTKETLLQEWPQDQFSFDLLHLPYDFQNKRFRGYALINFTSEHHAMSFKRRWHGQKLQPHGTCSKLDITPSRIQGFENMVEYVQDQLSRRPKGDKYLPAVFVGSHRIQFRSLMNLPRSSATSSVNVAG